MHTACCKPLSDISPCMLSLGAILEDCWETAAAELLHYICGIRTVNVLAMMMLGTDHLDHQICAIASYDHSFSSSLSALHAKALLIPWHFQSAWHEATRNSAHLQCWLRQPNEMAHS